MIRFFKQTKKEINELKKRMKKQDKESIKEKQKGINIIRDIERIRKKKELEKLKKTMEKKKPKKRVRYLDPGLKMKQIRIFSL
jgi:hypothetical protein